MYLDNFRCNLLTIYFFTEFNCFSVLVTFNIEFLYFSAIVNRPKCHLYSQSQTEQMTNSENIITESKIALLLFLKCYSTFANFILLLYLNRIILDKNVESRSKGSKDDINFIVFHFRTLSLLFFCVASIKRNTY